MGRWEPDARGRLMHAAFELFAERGYEQSTVADIAQRAGLTERTFFRHFTDKREVLFGGADSLAELVVSTVAAVAADLPPIDAAAAGIAAAGAAIQQAGIARQRQLVIGASAELQERELVKLASLAAQLAGALRARGVQDAAASLIAEAAIAVFRVAFERWVDDSAQGDLPQLIEESLGTLRAAIAGH